MFDYKEWYDVEAQNYSEIKHEHIHSSLVEAVKRRGIEALQYGCVISGTLAHRLRSLILSFEAETANKPCENPRKVALSIILRSVPQGGKENDYPPSAPGDKFLETSKTPYSKMMADLLDGLNKSMDTPNVDDESLCRDAILKGLEDHLKKVEKFQVDWIAGIDTLQAPTEAPTEAATTFGELKPTNYDLSEAYMKEKLAILQESEAYIKEHPGILQESEGVGLLKMAYQTAVENKNSTKPRQYAHQAMLLCYCYLFGCDNVTQDMASTIFFRKFHEDVDVHLQHILGLAEQGRQARAGRVQIRTLDPSAEILIKVPEAGSEARAIFDQFAPEMQATLETGSLDSVNNVLGEMNVTEAQKLFGLLRKANCLYIQQRFPDATADGEETELEDLEEHGEIEAHDNRGTDGK